MGFGCELGVDPSRDKRDEGFQRVSKRDIKEVKRLKKTSSRLRPGESAMCTVQEGRCDPRRARPPIFLIRIAIIRIALAEGSFWDRSQRGKAGVRVERVSGDGQPHQV